MLSFLKSIILGNVGGIKIRILNLYIVKSYKGVFW